MKIPTLYCISIFSLLLFGGPNLIGAIGIDIKYYYAAIMLFCFPLILYNKKSVLKNKRLLWLLLFCTTYGLFFMYYDRSEGSRYTSLVIMSTPIFFSAFPLSGNIKWHTDNYTLHKKITTLFILFFILETLIASVERILGFNILGWHMSEGETIMDLGTAFRSTSLHGHPLYNALMVSTSMAFILTSQIRMKTKLMLWMLGFFSILCFNTRSSIAGNAIMLFVFTIYTLRKGHHVSRNDKRVLISMVGVITLVGALLFFVMGFGSRLAEMGLFDDSSAMARVDVFNVFENYPLGEFLWGMDSLRYEYVLYYAGIEVTENFYIDFILRNGIVFLVVYLVLYIRLIKILYRGYDWFTKWFTGGGFFLIASTNNSLATLGVALYLFLILIVLFNPKWNNI